MKPILNPFSDVYRDDYHCFGCSPFNRSGLQLKFWDTGEEIIANWEPEKRFESYPGVLHGGIQVTLMDETASWAVYTKCRTAGVTAKLNVRYIRPVYISKGIITLKAKIKEFKRRVAVIECILTDGENQVCAESELTFFCFPEDIARDKYRYPGQDAFYG